MVSTRGVRYKFSEGERVLCYEPDPTKAKVLYDSKVLEVIESKDKRGRRTVEYLIHFQGWNSSWDRCVGEDFVLKDTEENRQLQRDLAEKSQLQLGAYLYRRERKKGVGSNSAPGAAKRSRHGFSDDGGSSTSTQPDEGETCEGEAESDSSSGSGSTSRPAPRPAIAAPQALRDRLTFDYHLVVKRGRVSKVPASPCVADILESFVKWFARAGAWNPPRARHEAPHRPDILDVSCKLNLLREVADGLRVYFDFILRGHLLYRQEQRQYHEMCGRHLDEPEEAIPHEETDESPPAEIEATEMDLKSPKIPEYSHLPPDPDNDSENNETSPEENNHEELPKAEESENDTQENNVDTNNKESTEEEPVHNNGTNKAKENCNDRRSNRTGGLARRLRSHKSVVSQSENEEPAPSTSTGEPRTLDTLSSSVGSSGGSSMSSQWTPRPPAPAAPAPHTPTPLSVLLHKVAKWELIPREGTEHLPCRVYGAIHLARLFVKLPDFLYATQMPDFKLKLILKHIDMFVQYLDEHSEWFGEIYYTTENNSRSH